MHACATWYAQWTWESHGSVEARCRGEEPISVVRSRSFLVVDDASDVPVDMPGTASGRRATCAGIHRCKATVAAGSVCWHFTMWSLPEHLLITCGPGRRMHCHGPMAWAREAHALSWSCICMALLTLQSVDMQERMAADVRGTAAGLDSTLHARLGLDCFLDQLA